MYFNLILHNVYTRCIYYEIALMGTFVCILTIVLDSFNYPQYHEKKNPFT